jgi:hypothetical protein
MLRSGRIRLNDQNRVVNAITREETPTFFGLGGIKKLSSRLLLLPCLRLQTLATSLRNVASGRLGGIILFDLL